MKKTLIVLLSLISHSLFSQNKTELQQKIEQLISLNNGKVGVSLIDLESGDSLSIHGEDHFPMMSVFKFHLALTVLDKVDKGELSLKQQILIKKSDLLEHTWSPFRDSFPDGNVSISLKEAIQWTVSVSDNNMCDVLIRLIGGVKTMDDYINNSQFVVKNDEAGMHENWEAQFLNTTTPNYSTHLLKQFYEKELLTKKSTKFLYTTMKETTVGQNRIKGKLPPNTIVAHRPGTSFTSDTGLSGAINDIGIIELPGGKRVILAVFIQNTTNGFKQGEALIADIARAVWDFYVIKDEQ